MATGAMWAPSVVPSCQWTRKPIALGTRNTSSCFLSGQLHSEFGLASASRSPRRLVKSAAVVPRAAAEDKEDGAPKEPKPKMPSAVKRAKLGKVRRIYHKSRKSEVKTRMKKVFAALETLQKKGSEAEEDEIKPVEKLIAEAYSIIDKSVKVHTLHRNTGARRKSRLARAKRSAMVALGWYTPEAAPAAL